MIVDCHVNLWKPEHFTPLYAEQMKRVRADGGYGLRADADTLAAELAAVDKAIVFSPRYGDSAGVEGDDDAVAEAVRRFPDRFVGFAYVDPRRPRYMDELVRSIEDLGLDGVKYGPIYNGVALSDPRMTPVYEYCVARDLPLTMHMGTTFARKGPADLGRVIHVEEVALRFPELRMVCAHMGHPWYEDTIAVVRKQPNVFCEISAIWYRPWQFWNILVLCEEYSIVDKISWGTDFPFARVQESIDGLRGVNRVVEGSGLPRVSQETIERILRSNPFQHWWRDDPLRR